MLARHGIRIAPPGTPDTTLTSNPKPGSGVALELGGRYLLKYLLASQVSNFANLHLPSAPTDFPGTHYVTPTPLAPEETVSWLALPAPDQPRPYVLLLKPELIPWICGPRWVRMGGGIEYILAQGFPLAAIVVIGSAPNTQWPLLVT